VISRQALEWETSGGTRLEVRFWRPSVRLGIDLRLGVSVERNNCECLLTLSLVACAVSLWWCRPVVPVPPYERQAA
jgi:hypothetical protein